ncbi:hypothetical protein O181_072764 [Austropuccinia psidii MF-1]|uniref:Uncharacterized protein n=1 Tax=Austropuccinia psidii MF-1 TaxID=1389203 RepID=A0A9Q3IBT5_9BASI|nr:hypothetical protein [Austropuccinia psidii MF-1]
MASGKPQRPPAQLKPTLPLNSRGRFPIPPCTPYSRMQEWCIYGIIYHYAPFLLSNPMVTFSGPSTMILKSKYQNPSPILKEDSSAHQSGNPWRLSEDHFRTPTTWPCRSWVGNSLRIIPRAILRGCSSFNQLSRQQVLQ